MGATFCPVCGKPVASGASTPSVGFQPQGYSAPPISNLATLGDRVVALIIDTIIIFLISLVILIPLLVIGFFGGSFAFSFPFFFFVGPIVLATWLLPLFYFTYFESTSGQTPGKQLAHIRTVDEKTLKPLDFGRSLVRNLLRIIDSLPFFYIVGLILVASTEKRQRIGDMAAASIVIKA
jgi:uncharacterized RDD family membrane protein YckC